MYWDVNNLYRWAMSQKLNIDSFKTDGNTFEFSKDFIENYNKNTDRGYFLEIKLQYSEKLHELHNDLPF